jgi:hypothetical protein
MNPTKELADVLYRDRVLQARRRSMTEKLLDGGSLFDEVCERMRAGIRSRFPGSDETEVQEILLRQIDRLRRVEESRVYRRVENGDEF